MEESSSESEERREATDAEREAAEEADAEDIFEGLGSRIKMYANDDFVTLYEVYLSWRGDFDSLRMSTIDATRSWPLTWHPTWQRRSAVLPLVRLSKSNWNSRLEILFKSH